MLLPWTYRLNALVDERLFLPQTVAEDQTLMSIQRPLVADC
jgi:hypothetical protein